MQKQCRKVNSFQGYQPNIESDSYNATIFQVKVPRSDNTMNQFQGYRRNLEWILLGKEMQQHDGY